MSGLKIRVYTLQKVEFVFKFLSIGGHKDGVGTFYRGHADATWPLVPTAGRPGLYLPNNRDLGRFNVWKKEAFPYMHRTFDNDWETLAFAQHHGLATRLLDWTGNPLVAAYFTVCSHPDKDGMIYGYYPPIWLDIKTAKLNQDNLHGAALITRAFDGRMLNQKGVFTVHCPPNHPPPLRVMEELKGRGYELEDSDLTNLCGYKIPKELKQELRETLDTFGINEAMIYPDVDGASRHINWRTGEMANKKKAGKPRHLDADED